MKGLDDYIMGVNDPEAPFNQQDELEMAEETLNKIGKITRQNKNPETIINEIFHLMAMYFNKKEVK